MKMDADRRHFLLRRAHSLSGVLPLAVFLFNHFFTNAASMFGPEAFDAAAAALHKIPYLLGVGEVMVAFLPLLFHSIYGFMITSTGSVNLDNWPQPRNFAYVMQRVTGVIIFVFVVYHVWNTRAQTVFFGTEIDFAYMAAYLTPGWVKAVYIIGVLAAVWHLANGLWSFSITWGLVRTPGGQRNLYYACMALFVAMSAVGIQIIFNFDPTLVKG